jgi:anti-sigma factor RsiW
MVVKCEDVWREISNYLEGDVDPGLRSAIEEHLRGCKHCTAVLEGTRNVIQVYGDERMFELPAGFSQRLRRRLEENMPSRRGTAFGWMVAFATAILLAGSFELGRASANPRQQLRSEHAQTSSAIPAGLVVVVSDEGKTFHLPGCTFIHDKQRLRTLTAGEAEREGYAPCVRCLRKYLKIVQTARVEPYHSDF